MKLKKNGKRIILISIAVLVTVGVAVFLPGMPEVAEKVMSVFQDSPGKTDGVTSHESIGTEEAVTNTEAGAGTALTHKTINTMPEVNYQNVSPPEFLEKLRQNPNSIYSVITVPDGWIKYEHIKELIKYVDSEEPCARVVSAISSYLPQKPSTVGNEAMFLIEGFIREQYPPSLHSEGFTERTPQWYKANWEEYWKEKLNEQNVFIYLRSRDNPEIELNVIKRYSGTSAVIYTVYDREELETIVSMIGKNLCIWIDYEAAEEVDKDWLYKKAIDEKYPVILIGRGNALYSFIDKLKLNMWQSPLLNK